MSNLYETPIGETVTGQQDAGREVYIRGFSADGRRALVVDSDRDTVSVAPVEAAGSLGRWECSTAHLAAYGALYAERFPRRS